MNGSRNLPARRPRSMRSAVNERTLKWV